MQLDVGSGAAMTDKPSKVLVIGSGPIVIGQAAEFDRRDAGLQGAA